MRTSPRTKAVAGAATVALALSLGAAVAAPAGATETGIAAIKTAAHDAIHERVVALDAASAVVDHSAFMGSDQAQRIGVMKGDVTALQQLDDRIQADTTVAQAKADAAKIFTDYRVFALVLPVTHLTRAADAVTKVAGPELGDKVAPKLQAAITKRGATDLQPLLDDLEAKVKAAEDAAQPVPAQTEALSPADWNANHDVLSGPRASIETARTDLRQARDDARKIVAALKQRQS